MDPFFGKNEAASDYLAMLLEMQENGTSSDSDVELYYQDGFFTTFSFECVTKNTASTAVNASNKKQSTAASHSDDDKFMKSKLQNALIRRAMESVRRGHILQGEKGCIMSLNAAGALSESFVATFLSAEKETMNETYLIRHEAELLKPGS
jgi:hypothetical protein